jgi:hypothetical protein
MRQLLELCSGSSSGPIFDSFIEIAASFAGMPAYRSDGIIQVKRFHGVRSVSVFGRPKESLDRFAICRVLFIDFLTDQPISRHESLSTRSFVNVHMEQ